MDAGKLRGFRGSVGYRNLFFGLMILVQLFGDCPTSVWSCGPRLDEIERAEQIAAAILKGGGLARRRDVPGRATTCMRMAPAKLRRREPGRQRRDAATREC